MGQENVFYDILEQKKNASLFQKKMGLENVFFDILEQKNAFLGQKKQKIQKVEKLPFFQRG